MSPESLPSRPGPDGMLENLSDSGQVRQNSARPGETESKRIQPERAGMTTYNYSA